MAETMDYEYGMHGQGSIETLIGEVRTEAVYNAGEHAIDNLGDINSALEAVMEGEAVSAVETAFRNNAQRFRDNCETIVNAFESEMMQTGAAYSDVDDGIAAHMENITAGN